MKAPLIACLAALLATPCTAMPLQWNANETGSVTNPATTGMQSARGGSAAMRDTQRVARFGKAMRDPTAPKHLPRNASFQKILDRSVQNHIALDLPDIIQTLPFTDSAQEKRRRARRTLRPMTWLQATENDAALLLF